MATVAAVGTAILGATVRVLLDKALSFATNRVGQFYGFNKDFESLRESVEMILAILLDAEDNQSQSMDVKLWLQRLEGVAYKAYEVLDELNYEILHHKVKSRNQPIGKVCSFFSFSPSHGSIYFHWRMAPKVQDIIKKLEAINQEANGFGLHHRTATSLLSTSTTIGAALNRETNSIVAPINVVGRYDDECRIVEMLLSSTDNVVSVLPIIGMGGLGKTTLAKLVFNHKRIQDNFNRRIWVCVSDKIFDKRRVFKLILEQLGESVQPDSSENTILQKIQKQFEGKRYLLVLDDVWNEDPQIWDDFYESLVGLTTVNKRSWCVVTSRKVRTATIMATHNHYWYSLGKLSDDDCWSILKEKVIASGEAPEELIAIKKKVIKRCAGLPLTAKVFGSLLRVQRKQEWPLIVEKKLMDVVEDHENNAMQILKLSFDYLPSPSIKKCFAYLSIFKEDTEMDRDDLIQLWMAEGFLQPDLVTENVVEQIGYKYLRILLESSLMETASDDDEGKVVYKLHDLVYDLAKSVSENETTILGNGVIDSGSRVRYLALDNFGKIPEKTLRDLSISIRTLFLTGGSGISIEILSKFKNLHVLKLFDWGTVELPSSIGKLKHMRYLDLPKSYVKTLPKSLCKLYNLQTLRIGSNSSQVLPKGMSNLISLRHLDYYNYDPKFQMPVNMGRLTCIQTLRFFNIGKGKGRGIEELGFLEELQGKLSIRNLELVKGKEGAKRAKLSGKQNLIDLEFCWGCEKDCGGSHNCDEVVLEGLEPHPNLQKLSIKNFGGEKFPQWFVNLSMLVRLNLEDCKSCLELPMLGHLPCLGYLRSSGFKKLSCIGASFYGQLPNDVSGSRRSLSGRKVFPALKTLILKRIVNLTEWKEAEVGAEEVSVFPVLENLTIKHCRQLITAPTHFPNLKNLKLLSCPKVTHLFGCSSSLQKLHLINCENLTELPKSLCQFKYLRSFEISGCSKILHLGPPPFTKMKNHDRHLKFLQDFTIEHCNGLTSIARDILACCTSLKSLKVYDCPNLVSFPLDFRRTPSLSSISLHKCPKLFTNSNGMPTGFGHLNCLRQLSIGPFVDDSSVELFDWSGLISCSSTLRRLSLYGLREMESPLPSQLQHLTSLTYLYLVDFGLLETLPDWLGRLMSLEELELWNCQKLQRLPSASAMSCLTKLRNIYVYMCPLLEESLRRERGPDTEWSKISHISLEI